MATTADQMASNINFGAFARAKDLQARILFTLGALIVFRIGTFIPIPGIDPEVYRLSFERAQAGLLGVFNVFSGGAIERMAIFALNVMPYISASIIVQLLSTALPAWEKLKKEGGEAGRKQLNQYTRYLTVVLAIAQATGIALNLNNGPTPTALDPGMFFIVTTIVTLVGGTLFLMWLGEQITARGIGQGTSLIIFVGIVAAIPTAIGQMLELARKTDQVSAFGIIAALLLSIAVVTFVVFVERSQRRVLIQYPKRQVGNRYFAGNSSYLPLKINTAGVIPPIFASSLLLLPTTILSAVGPNSNEWLRAVAGSLAYGQPLHTGLYALMIVFFAFFYTSIVFNPEETADNLKRHGGFVQGVRPGKATADYLDRMLTRLTVIGAAYLTVVCILPELFYSTTHAAIKGLMFALGGTSLLIVVSVTMDTVTQVQSHLLAHQYEGLIKRSKLKGKDR